LKAGFKYLVVLFFIGVNVVSQTDFFRLYRQVTDLQQRVETRWPLRKDIRPGDSAEIAEVQRARYKVYIDSMPPLFKRLNGLSFPDISFTDVANKDRSLSDFKGSDLIINYTYLYSMRCIHRIDSTLKRIAAKNVKLLVLVADPYKKDLVDLEQYGDKIIVGTINEDTSDLVSLKQGNDCMYYLNASRQIEFFDRQENNHHQAWLAFLDKHFQ